MAAPPGFRLPPAAQVAWLVGDPTGFYAAGRRRFGPVFTVRFPGLPPEVCVATAELAREVFATDGGDAGGSRAGAIRREFVGPLVGEQSLLLLDREPWWRHRRLVNPSLHGRAVAGWRDRIAAIAAAEVDGWPVGVPFALRDRVERVTLEVIMRMVFGISDAARLSALRALLPELVSVGGSPALLRLPPRLRDRALGSPLLRRVRALPTTRFARLRDAVDAILYDEIARRRARPEPGATDVLSQLVAARDDRGEPLTDQEVRDELLTLLQAGHETTATALAWTFERLVRTPRVLRRLRAELAAGEGSEYLDAVVKEALRARPVVLGAPRLLDAPVRIGGYEVPAGWYLSASMPLVLSDPEAFPAPGEFRPERFLGPGADAALRSWMPFGGGHRYCAGAQLATLEMRVVITEVLRRVDLVPARPEPERPRVKNVTLAPARSTRVVARPRRDEAKER
ncbi:cytochrome P450 [Actinomadura kijaniata]|uniref:Cytochrome P450 n=1 Tax=Actinomadura namibiensis TaxID=182080 RepID=A0A7W3LV87_ACTNM|nr:cytochrome P450 [Actinomadura namibiensis]MBA8954891.1 cytochrome P450 [Actinomadura namibiensis]